MDQNLEGKVVLLVHAGSMRKKFIFDVLKKLNVRIICLNREVAEAAKPYVEFWINEDLNKTDDCINKIKNFQIDHPGIHIAGVLTFWDECILLTSKIAEEFKLIGIPFGVSSVIKNKYSFRDACYQNYLEVPRHQMVGSLKDIDNLNPKMEYPLVIKPVHGACSAFVMRVDNKEELKKAYRDIRTNIKSFWLAPEWYSLEVLAEEYIDGDEVDMDILLQNGNIMYVNIIDNAKTNEPYFVETAWSCPSGLYQERKDNLVAMAKETLEKLEVKNGCIHFEAKSKLNGEAIPIEVNLRMGGSEVYIYSKLVWGVDLVENAVRIAVGSPVVAKPPQSPNCYLLSHRFLPDFTCRVDKIEVNEEIKKQDYYVDLYFETKVGEVFRAPPDGYDHSIGILTVSGKTADEAKGNLIKAIEYIKYEVVKI